jgi:two-component system chemotaxis sensor kinase CheA
MSDIKNDEKLMDAFYEEVQNLIGEMRKDLATLVPPCEAEGSVVMNRLFRNSHIIKSDSGSVGFDDLNELSKNLERIFKKAKEGDLCLTVETISLLSEAVEACQKLLNEEKVKNYKELLKRLNSIIQP